MDFSVGGFGNLYGQDPSGAGGALGGGDAAGAATGSGFGLDKLMQLMPFMPMMAKGGQQSPDLTALMAMMMQKGLGGGGMLGGRGIPEGPQTFTGAAANKFGGTRAGVRSPFGPQTFL